MYENDYIGKIVYIKDIVFATGKIKLDHAYSIGRPCLLIYNDEEYDYFLTISSKIKTKSYAFDYYKLCPDDFMFLYKYENIKNMKDSDYAHGFINLRNIYKKRVSGYGINDSGKIKLETYKEIIKKLKYLHNKDNMNEIVNSAKAMGR